LPLRPLTSSISDGLAIGFLIYALFMLGVGHAKQLSLTAWVLAAFFLLHLFLR